MARLTDVDGQHGDGRWMREGGRQEGMGDRGAQGGKGEHQLGEHTWDTTLFTKHRAAGTCFYKL